MKNLIILTFVSLLLQLPFNLAAQDIHLDVEGHVKIRGNIDIHQPEDSTSIYIGKNAGINSESSTSRRNTIVGSFAAESMLTGNENSLFGHFSGHSITDGNENTFSGNYSGTNTTIGYSNSFFGNVSGANNNTGNNNSFFGSQCGSSNTNGHSNSFFGDEAGFQNLVGSKNTFIGAESGIRSSPTPDSLDKAIALGYNAKVACHSCAVIGGTGDDAVKVGIGTITPSALLHIEGDANQELKLRDIGSVVSINMHTYEHPTTQWQMKAESHKLLPMGETVADASIIFQYGQDSLFRIKGDGNANLAGTLTENSDIRLKTNISMLSGVLPRLLKLHGYTYNWLDAIKNKNLQIGLIAQEVNDAFPELIQEDESGVMSVSYTRFVPLLIEGIREQQVEINKLKSLSIELIKRIEILENR